MGQDRFQKLVNTLILFKLWRWRGDDAEFMYDWMYIKHLDRKKIII